MIENVNTILLKVVLCVFNCDRVCLYHVDISSVSLVKKDSVSNVLFCCISVYLYVYLICDTHIIL